jgi:quercetin dioxygenase-like cupin family protein
MDPIGVPLSLGGDGRGVVLGLASTDLNVNEVRWPAGDGVGRHRNDELDVLLVVIAGDATVSVDGVDHRLSAGQILLVPKGAARAVTAGPDGVRYLTCHRRRGPIGLSTPSPPGGQV